MLTEFHMQLALTFDLSFATAQYTSTMCVAVATDTHTHTDENLISSAALTFGQLISQNRALYIAK
jgi:hypothetical protein